MIQHGCLPEPWKLATQSLTPMPSAPPALAEGDLVRNRSIISVKIH